MADDPKRTPVPASVQAKMREGMRQRYAIATTPSANPKRGEGER